jgi:hypothetical protein
LTSSSALARAAAGMSSIQLDTKHRYILLNFLFIANFATSKPACLFDYTGKERQGDRSPGTFRNEKT